MDALEALDELHRLLDTTDGETVDTSMRLPVALRDATLRLHYEQHPSAKPTLGEVAFALAVQDGSPLADRPDLIARAAVAVAARIQSATSSGVVDARIGATVRSLSPAGVVVLTSDPADIALCARPPRSPS